MQQPRKKIHLGKLLVENHLITQEQFDKALEEQKATGEKLGRILIDLGFVSQEQLLELLSQQLQIPYVDLKHYSLDADTVRILPEFYARKLRAMVLRNDEQGILVGVVDPQDVVATDELEKILNRSIQIALVNEDDLLKMIDMMYRRTSEITSFAEELSEEFKGSEYDIVQMGEGLSSIDAPVVRLLQSIFEDAVQINASDIHIEPDEHILRIRQRLDGILHEHIVNEKHVADALTLRLKLMAGLNISEKRLPQDGRFSIKIKNQNFDVRLSTLPVQFGESVVMRLLNQSAEILDLGQIGMPEEVLTQFRKILTLPHGILLITGPTGSGKTTTLYGALTELNNAQTKIITVEDPVEYRLPRLSQVQVQAAINLTFARILRSILRQDPDIIMIGELRDEETVSIAIRAALTGHFVLSTLHTNDAVSSAIRLLDMGAEGYLVASVLRAIIAQRLVRRICHNCQYDYSLTLQEKIWLEATAPAYLEKTQFKAGKGCTYCHNTGYKGQIGVFEMLEMNPLLGEALRQSDTGEFARLAKLDPDFKSLALNGLEIAIKGITTVSEVIRIAGETITE